MADTAAPLVNEFGDPLPEPHYIKRNQIEADGWHCTVCGESVDFIDSQPYHDNPHLNPEGEDPSRG